jgi:hypothetical protein
MVGRKVGIVRRRGRICGVELGIGEALGLRLRPEESGILLQSWRKTIGVSD